MTNTSGNALTPDTAYRPIIDSVHTGAIIVVYTAVFVAGQYMDTTPAHSSAIVSTDGQQVIIIDDAQIDGSAAANTVKEAVRYSRAISRALPEADSSIELDRLHASIRSNDKRRPITKKT